jgi:hypothetical protein
MRVPADAYQRSSRHYPRKLVDSRSMAMEPELVHRLDKYGRLRWRRRNILISSALAHEYVIVDRAADSWTHFVVLFGGIRLGAFDSEQLGRGLRIPRRRRLKAGEVSGMSLDRSVKDVCGCTLRTTARAVGRTHRAARRVPAGLGSRRHRGIAGCAAIHSAAQALVLARRFSWVSEDQRRGASNCVPAAAI